MSACHLQSVFMPISRELTLCLFMILISDDDDNEVIMSKWNAICSKILIRATLDKGIASTDDAIVNVHIQNAHLKYPITLIHLLWINLYEHKIVTMNQNGFAEPITLVSCKLMCVICKN